MREALLKHIKDEKVTRQDVQRVLGVSSATVSLYLSGKYRGNNTVLDIKTKEYLSRYAECAQLASALPNERFVMTRQAKMAYGILRNCHLDNDMGLIIGEPGLGKTKALERYTQENKGTLMITPLKTNTMMTLLKHMTETLRFKTSESNDARARGIINILKGSGRMIIVDEAHFLSFPCLEILRQIHDGAGVGLVYAGPEALRAKISNRDIEQIYSRIGITATLPDLNESDNHLILESTGIRYTASAARRLYEISIGSGRRAAKTFKRACRIAQGDEVTDRHILLAERQSVMG